ncbi:MAG TPA: type II secretion system major pseudopilin GspG [Pontiellaceae bacterium]|nr:type II secretion system major pseudopilin GspG [Pontiellaceae bacterium]HPR82654.1 type II secretion system major pseudopilin GspG [Pontiellaceae bacterium]
MKKRKQAKQGFTLVELLVVITILLIIGTFATQQVINEPDKAKVKVTKASFTSLENALERFKLDVGRYPTQEEGLSALYTAPDGVENWAGKYLTKSRALRDAWDNDYVYIIPGKNNEPYEIISLGADKAEGGEKYNADLSNLDEK